MSKKLTRYSQKYKCLHSCEMGECPGHELEVFYNESTKYGRIVDNKGGGMYFCGNLAKAINKIFAKIE